MDLNLESNLLSSARVARLKFDDLSEAVSWSGLTDPFLPYWDNFLPDTLTKLCTALQPSSANRLKSMLRDDGTEDGFALDFNTNSQSSRYMFMVTMGNSTTTKECFFHVLDRKPDVTDSKSNIKGLKQKDINEEAHHRAKNILQSIISYLNLLIIGRDNLTKNEIDRVINYVYVLAAEHDVLHDQSLNQSRVDLLRLDRVILTLFSRFSLNNNIKWNELPTLVVKSTRAASLSLFLVKTIRLICADIDRDISVTIQVELVAGNRARIEVSRSTKSNEMDLTDPALVPGMRIIQLLLKADRCSSFDLAIRGERLSALFEFQLDTDDSKLHASL